jgi:prefoldin subunit 5
MPEENEIKALQNQINELRATVMRLERVIDGLADVIRPPSKDLKQGRITRWMND